MRKTGYLVLGYVCLALGFIGAFLPVMPTTVFILIAAWAFARSSDKLHQALLDHPKTGPAIRNWRANQCIPVKAKVAAVTSIGISWIIVVITTNQTVSAVVAMILMAVVFFILTRPSTPITTDLSDEQFSDEESSTDKISDNKAADSGEMP